MNYYITIIENDIWLSKYDIRLFARMGIAEKRRVD